MKGEPNAPACVESALLHKAAVPAGQFPGYVKVWYTKNSSNCASRETLCSKFSYTQSAPMLNLVPSGPWSDSMSFELGVFPLLHSGV